MYEIERKFLISPDKIPVLSYEAVRYSRYIETFFIQTNPEIQFIKEVEGYTENRTYYRVEDGIKSEIPEDEYYDNFPRHIHNIVKYRSYKLYDEIPTFLSTYTSHNLNIIEVQFKNEKEAESFEVPDWFCEEITGVSEYEDVNIATK